MFSRLRLEPLESRENPTGPVLVDPFVPPPVITPVDTSTPPPPPPAPVPLAPPVPGLPPIDPFRIIW